MTELFTMYAKEVPSIAGMVLVIYMFLLHNRQTHDGYQALIAKLFDAADRDE